MLFLICISLTVILLVLKIWGEIPTSRFPTEKSFITLSTWQCRKSLISWSNLSSFGDSNTAFYLRELLEALGHNLLGQSLEDGGADLLLCVPGSPLEQHPHGHRQAVESQKNVSTPNWFTPNNFTLEYPFLQFSIHLALPNITNTHLELCSQCPNCELDPPPPIKARGN